jgi:subtilisin family serine protease
MKVILLIALLFVLPAVYSRAAFHLGDPSLVVPNQYMVVLQENTSVAVRDAHIGSLLGANRLVGGAQESVFWRWSATVVGYAAILSKDSVEVLLEDPLVRWVEQDQIVQLFDDTVEEQIQVDPQAWGLRRIDQVDFIFNDDSYSYWASGGAGVDVYIIDTGILLTHDEFGGRAVSGTNTVPGEADADCNGHGTHVSSTAAGLEFGVAKNAVLIAVKVLGCSGSGTWTGVNQGIEWTTTSHQSRGRRSVANMSLGGAVSATTDAAVAASIAAGVNYAIAAGNSNTLTCNFSPARVDTAVSVGATTYTLNANPSSPSQDVRSSFSNYGTCTKIFAPGQNIKAAWIGSNTATNVISGTSMASPHVAGVIAVYIGHLLADDLDNPTPAQVLTFLTQVATPNHISNPGTGSPNLLLYSPYA